MQAPWKLALGVALGAACAFAAAEDNYPSRPIRIVVGFPAGGGGDGVARIVGEHLSRTLGQPVVVENRPGAGTTLAPSFVASAPPDGYTLLLAPDEAFGPDKAMWAPNVKFDEKSFTPISKWASTFFVLAANPKYGVKNLQELKAKAKAGNGEVFVASTLGLYPSLILENFNRSAGYRLKQVPYKGCAPSVLGTVAGEAPLTVGVPSCVMPQVKQNKLVALAITGRNRSALAEGVAPLAEQGFKDFDVSYWFGLAGPAGLPQEIQQKLFDASAKALADPGVQEKLHTLGYEVTPSKSISEFRTEAVERGTALRKLVEEYGIKGS